MGLFYVPGIVGADVPEIAFGVAAGEGTATVGLVGDVEDDGGAGGFGGGVDGVGVVDDEAGGFGLAEADLVGMDHEFAVGVGVVALRGDGAEHDHAVAEGELGVHDGVVRAEVDGLFFEAEGLDEPVDGGEGVTVTEAGDDGGRAGSGWRVHVEGSLKDMSCRTGPLRVGRAFARLFNWSRRTRLQWSSRWSGSLFADQREDHRR